MRPVEKGDAPFQANEYGEYRDPLVARIGAFCSYCELRLTDLIPIEHILPQTKYPALATEWTNLVLACYSCNRSKGSTDTFQAGYIFPDEANTWLHLRLNASTHEAEGLTPEGQLTIGLVGLNSEKSKAKRKGVIADIKDLLDDTLTREVNDLPATHFTSLTNVARRFGHLTLWLALYYAALPTEQHLSALLAAFPGTTREHFEQARHILTP